MTNLVSNGFVTAIPYLAAGIGMILIGRSSDVTGERRWHYAGVLLHRRGGAARQRVGHEFDSACGHGFVDCVYRHSRRASAFSGRCRRASCKGTAAVAGIAVINSIANLAGYVSPYVLGIVKDATHSVTFGLVLIAGALISRRPRHR